jgi:hypothetical protein
MKGQRVALGASGAFAWMMGTRALCCNMHVSEPPKKIEILRGLMARGDWQGALRLAAKFPRLGEHKARIERGWEAIQRPDFYRQIGRNPDALIADGIAALKERYP